MSRDFRLILVRIATLPMRDQKWLMQQLSAQEKKLFVRQKGYSLLKKARRFSALSMPQVPQETEHKSLPTLCNELCLKNPLEIAVILEQGCFEWQASFLNTYDKEQKINKLIREELNQLKPATKIHIFQQWRKQLDFQAHLELGNG